MISFRTEHLLLRSPLPEDKSEYMAIRSENSGIANVYKSSSDLLDSEWEQETTSPDSIFLAVFYEEQLVGIGSLQGVTGETIELGIDVEKDRQGNGIGTEMLAGLCSYARKHHPEKRIELRTKIDNAVCRHVAEKCGGILEGCDYSFAARALLNLYQATGADINSTSLVEKDVCVYKFPV